MFRYDERCLYMRNQLAEVICQLRFPEIAELKTEFPAKFQEIIKQDYPTYTATREAQLPKITGGPGNFSLQNLPDTINHQFQSVDGTWHINLTSKFFSLTATNYGRWEDFARKLDLPLAAFIKYCRPKNFERIGLRYLNFFSRQALGLEDTPFRELFIPCYLGPIGEEDVDERSMNRCSTDAEVALFGGVQAKIHAGPGRIAELGKPDPEIKFIFDQDLYIQGDIPVNLSASAMENMHTQADAIFRGAITDKLHLAMEPEII